jgi:hypothetical protein
MTNNKPAIYLFYTSQWDHKIVTTMKSVCSKTDCPLALYDLTHKSSQALAKSLKTFDAPAAIVMTRTPCQLRLDQPEGEILQQLQGIIKGGNDL